MAELGRTGRLSRAAFLVSASGVALGCGSRSALLAGIADSAAGSASTSGASSVGGRFAGGASGGSSGESAGGSAPTPQCEAEMCENGGRCLPHGNAFVCDCRPGTFGARCETRMLQLAAGYHHACGVLSDASVRCWGKDVHGSVNDTPTAKAFQSVAVSGDCDPGGCRATSCALHLDGTVECWGVEPEAPLPRGRFKQIALEARASRMVCGVTLDDTLLCSTPGSNGTAVALAGHFEKVALDGQQVCGLRPTAAIACWDVAAARALPEQAGPFRDLAFGAAAWRLTSSGGLQCLGPSCSAPLPAGPFSAISAAAGFARDNLCAIQADETLLCTSGAPPQGRYRSVSVGAGLDCGIQVDGSVRCWGKHDLIGQALPPSGTFQSLSAGDTSTCGLRTDGSAECWGDDTDYSYYNYLTHRVITEPPALKFREVTLQEDLACGITADKALECWGDWRWDGREPLPQGSFSAVFPGCDCAIDTQGKAVCWGAERWAFPAGPLAALTCRVGQSCALDRDGTLTCFPVPPPEDAPPPTRFSAISAGLRHSCGIEAGSSALRCWGSDSDGQASPPAGGFSDVSCGQAHCCAVNALKEVECWGANESGQSSPRPGAFDRVAAGAKHTCGLRVDQTVSCWGELLY